MQAASAPAFLLHSMFDPRSVQERCDNNRDPINKKVPRVKDAPQEKFACQGESEGVKYGRVIETGKLDCGDEDAGEYGDGPRGFARH